ncbi:ABC transporter permease [Amycolatopsis suaedae]|uniref:ABC transporter permease subunit n=1 Tax=Amycolatopsis suaedae TaxID=2510978 RepID=A0A4Q7J246_9PSEU|nr:ABC transporter permease subunit [Amycolatopsis suaedae]RZQ61501.1 ABC transporter permease subunit [Amycolatopsis suaedae]
MSRTISRLGKLTFTSVITWSAAACFILVLVSLFASVVLEAFSTEWRGGWWPAGFTVDWFAEAWHAGVGDALVTTVQAAVAVVVIALSVGVPAGYALARRSFPGKSVVVLLLLLPVMLPPLTYAVQLTALLYRIGLGGSLAGVIIANLVPTVPLVVLITIPFVQRISPEIENAARVFGANTFRLLVRVLAPLLRPGIFAAAMLVMVRMLGSFELTFFVANQQSQTLVVTLYGAAADPAGPPPPLIAAMAVFYMGLAVVLLIAGLRYVNPADAVTARRI